jgi:two-component system nitrate/nitrite sensor histidine kinase NarX
VNSIHKNSRQPGRRRWPRVAIVAAVLLLIFVYESIEVGGLVGRSNFAWVVLDVFVLLAFGALAYLATDRMLRSEDAGEELKTRLASLEKQLADAQQRQKTILDIGQMFAEADDENEIMDLTLNLSRDLLGAKGASFVPLDEHAQPLTARVIGELPLPSATTWVEYLASPAVRQQCGICQKREEIKSNCPLIQGTFLSSMGVYCLPLTRNDQEFGILNLYFPQSESLDGELQTLIRTLLDEASLALDGVRLRNRALSTLRQLQVVRENTDLDSMLVDLLKDLHETLDADYALVSIWDAQTGRLNTSVSSGDISETARHLVDGILQSAKTSGAPVILENLTGSMASAAGPRALMVVPLITRDGPAAGAILVASRRMHAFNQRQLAMLQTIASQVALVVQNAYLVTQLEYKAMIDERTRLAREIHDGLAQTLGFLKLKIAQMRSMVAQNDSATLGETVEICYDVVSEAYQDARQAIDGLRVSFTDEGLLGWLKQTAEDFQDYCDIGIEVFAPQEVADLPTEVHAQLVRIVQEALSNIRKHSKAKQVEIICQQTGSELLLEIRDDGQGFDVHEIPAPSRHGLLGMRERADLIGADFQVISQPHQGTIVSIRLPLEMKVEE